MPHKGALVGGTVEITTQGGTTKSVTWETGKACWLDAGPPGELHADINTGTTPIEVMVIETR